MNRIGRFSLPFTIVFLCVARASVYLRDNGMPTITAGDIVPGLIGFVIVATCVGAIAVMFRRGWRLWQIMLAVTSVAAFAAAANAAFLFATGGG